MTKNIPARVITPFAVYIILSILWCFYSFGLTDPNLVFSSQPHFWQFQQTMWKMVFDVPGRAAVMYAVLLTLYWVIFGWMSWVVLTKKVQIRLRWRMVILVAAGLPLLLANNALSHDIFNYIFNARIVVLYHANPHQVTALDFPDDTWVRFMHNTHTTAPYGQGFTIISALPYLMGFGKFLPTWFLFKIISIASAVATILFAGWWGTKEGIKSAYNTAFLLLLSPFFLIEFVMNAHNDGLLLFPAIVSLWLLWKFAKRGGWKILAGALLLFGLSVAIKLVTIVLLPVFLFVIFSKLKRPGNMKWSVQQLAMVSSFLLFIPLLMSRSQYFHPWYLFWSLAWLPLIESPARFASQWRLWLVALAISSTYRYLPWLSTGGYDQGLAPSVSITWGGGVLLFLIFLLLEKRFQQK